MLFLLFKKRTCDVRNAGPNQKEKQIYTVAYNSKLTSASVEPEGI